MKGLRAFGLLFFTFFIGTVFGDKQECSSVADKFSAFNIGHASLVPESKIHDVEMEICYKGSQEKERQSCCTRQMERKYHVSATKDFSDTVKLSSELLKTMLQQRGAELQDQFVALIKEAENRTNSLLASEFDQLPLEARREPLDSFFRDLTAYIRQREVDLHDTVATLFNEIFPPVVQYLLTDANRLDVDAEYRECLMAARQSLIPRPFGEAPNLLAVELSNGLGLARLFLEAVSVGVETINTTSHLPWDLPCQRAVTRLTYCSQCTEDVSESALNARPCAATCRAIISGCLGGGVSQLGPAWDAYADALVAMTKATEQNIDIAGATHRIPEHISEAVMHAMQSAHKYYSKMIGRCGQPKSLQGDAALKTATDATKTPTKPFTPQEPLNAPLPRDQAFAKQMEEVAAEIKSSKGFYDKLADAICSNERYSAPPNTPCWDGRKVSASYGDVALEKTSKHDLKLASVKPQALVTLNDKLAHIKKKLNKKASSSSSSSFSDFDEQMQADSWNYGGGSGGGSSHGNKGGNRGGSYYGGNTVDDEDYSDDYSGSGYGSGGGKKKPRPGKHPNYNTGGRGGVKGGVDDEDMYIDDNDNKEAYIKNTALPEQLSGATINAPSTLTALLSFLALYMWING